MNEKNLTRGLELLSEQMPAPAVDIDEVMATGRAHARRRQAIGATAFTAVGVVAAIAVIVQTLSTGDSGGNWVGAPSSTATRPAPVNGKFPMTATTDSRSRTLTAQLAAAKAGIIPATLQTTVDDTRNTDNIIGGPPPALEFRKLEIVGEPNFKSYVATAKLTDQQGYGTVRISVDKASPQQIDSALLCNQGNPNCSTKAFADGTKATFTTHIGDRMGWNQRMSAVRPDGTLVQVNISVFDTSGAATGPSRPEVPLTTAQLFEFATVFTY
jgi:hypothetical protein